MICKNKKYGFVFTQTFCVCIKSKFKLKNQSEFWKWCKWYIQTVILWELSNELGEHTVLYVLNWYENSINELCDAISDEDIVSTKLILDFFFFFCIVHEGLKE